MKPPATLDRNVLQRFSITWRYKMKKFISIFITLSICLSLLILSANAATTYKDFTYDLSQDHKEVWFADVVYQGEIVGFGYLHYTVSSGWWIFASNTKLLTEFQNYGLPRTYGENNGFNVSVRAYGRSASFSESEVFSWSDYENRGGSSNGWIEATVELGSEEATYLEGHVTVSTPSGTNTAHYRVNK